MKDCTKKIIAYKQLTEKQLDAKWEKYKKTHKLIAVTGAIPKGVGFPGFKSK